jgi:hypothetical protein
MSLQTKQSNKARSLGVGVKTPKKEVGTEKYSESVDNDVGATEAMRAAFGE